ncbi:archaeal heat shock protein Hsp20 [Candidatus Harpocratesius sp.]
MNSRKRKTKDDKSKDKSENNSNDEEDDNVYEKNNKDEFDYEDDHVNEQFDPFNLSDDFFKMLNDQMRNSFKAFPGIIPPNFDAKSMRKIFTEIFKKMNLDPHQINNLSPEELQKFIQKNRFGFQGPFVFGMNFGIGPDGKPIINSFGNVKPKPRGEPEIKVERDPLVDIFEEDNDLVVVAEVPGVQKENIELKASPFELEIVASSLNAGKSARNYRKVVPLPTEINPDIAKARYTNGILEVRLEKRTSHQSKKRIKID